MTFIDYTPGFSTINFCLLQAQFSYKKFGGARWELRKYISLAADANPNILEVVFADDSDILKITEAGRQLRANRHLFLSKKARHTFSGYAMSQLKRIESHRRWLLNPPTAPPQRSDFFLLYTIMKQFQRNVEDDGSCFLERVRERKRFGFKAMVIL